jgi:hypothetical protein
MAVLAQRLRENVPTRTERRLHVGHTATLASPDQVRAPLLMNKDIIGESCIYPDHSPKRLVIHFNQLHSILGLRSTIGDDNRHRVAHVPSNRPHEGSHRQARAQVG